MKMLEDRIRKDGIVREGNAVSYTHLFQPRCAPRFWNRRWCTRACPAPWNRKPIPIPPRPLPTLSLIHIYANIQHYLENALDYAVKEHHVAARAVGIVMDVNTGACLLYTSLCALQQLFISLISAFFAGHPAFRHAPIISSNQFISSTERCSNLVWGFQSG